MRWVEGAGVGGVAEPGSSGGSNRLQGVGGGKQGRQRAAGTSTTSMACLLAPLCCWELTHSSLSTSSEELVDEPAPASKSSTDGPIVRCSW